MLAPMAKVRIAGRKELLEDALGVLGETGAVHLVDANRVPAADGLTPCEPTARTRARRAALRARLREVEEAASLLELDPEAPVSGARDGDLDRLTDDLGDIRGLTRERKELRDELAVAERYRALCEAFAPALASLGRLRQVSSLGVTLDARYRDEVLPALRERLAEVTGGSHHLLWRMLDEGTVGVLILFPARAGREVAALLSRENIQEIRLPRRYEELPLQEGLAAVGRLLDALPDRLADVERELAVHRAAYRDTIPAAMKRFRAALERAEVNRLVSATRYLFVVEGYLPASAVGRVRAAFGRRFGDEVQVAVFPLGPGDREEAPVLFENPAFFRPFQRLLFFLPPPRYGTLDPTPLMALSFPVFFGLILGDAGYGALGLGGALWVHRRWGRSSALGRDLAVLLAAASASSVVFGLLYGEVFGDLGHRLGLRPLWEDRMGAAAALLVLAVSVGAVHVLLGFALGAVQALRARARSRAAASAAGGVALLGLLAVVAAVAGALPQGSWRAAVAALVGAVALLVYLEGAVALVELVSAVGNVLSYARLMALGLASAALALVANELAGATGSLLAGAAVAAVLHLLNLALGLFSPTVHSLRLHYVEFLPRFYQYGGRAYRPFRKGEAP